MADSIALLCMLYPASPEKQDRCLSLLRRSARDYYRRPSAKCTTWSYFVNFPPPKISTPEINGESRGPQLVIGGMEMYTSKSALQAQVQDPVYFQAYHETVKREDLYAKPEVLEAWFESGGFVVRDGTGEMGEPSGRHGSQGAGVLVSVTRVMCLGGKQGKAVELLRSFSKWVRRNEPNVFTYVLFTRPKAPEEVLIFVRYRDSAALRGHSNAPEHVAVLKAVSQLKSEGAESGTTMWMEVEDSFVSNDVGSQLDSLVKL